MPDCIILLLLLQPLVSSGHYTEEH